jgi:hypothetical protein
MGQMLGHGSAAAAIAGISAAAIILLRWILVWIVTLWSIGQVRTRSERDFALEILGILCLRRGRELLGHQKIR